MWACRNNKTQRGFILFRLKNRESLLLRSAKGNGAEAQSALAEARRLNPQLTIKSFAETMPALPIVIDGLRKAGLPEV
jgi:hypothetical protein